ncbi:uncharacterized protein PAE49_013083 [Odontesthes bonariensis]
MSAEDGGAAAPGAELSDDEYGPATSRYEDEGNRLVQLQSQIQELSKKHDNVMSSIADLGNVQARSIVYIPREKHIVPFSGEPGKDVYTVDEFIEEVERTMRARGLRTEDQVDFILSLLRGSALEEVKLCMRGWDWQPGDVYTCLREAFREKRSTPQLLHAFYARRQLDGEDLRDYSHALSRLLNTALQQSPDAVADAQLALRDQFIEGVRDSALRRELRRLVREKPRSTLFDVREEAIMWALEDRPRSSNVARSRNLVGASPNEVTEKANRTTDSPTDLKMTLQEVVKIIAQQGKAIGELTNAVRELTTQTVSSGGGPKSSRPKVQPKYTSEGQPICLRCEGVGHIARQCTTPRTPGSKSVTPPPAVQGNESPPLL